MGFSTLALPPAHLLIRPMDRSRADKKEGNAHYLIRQRLPGARKSEALPGIVPLTACPAEWAPSVLSDTGGSTGAERASTEETPTTIALVNAALSRARSASVVFLFSWQGLPSGWPMRC